MMKLIKQEQGALVLNLHGENQITLNWKDNMIELYHNGERKYCIDMNEEIKK